MKGDNSFGRDSPESPVFSSNQQPYFSSMVENQGNSFGNISFGNEGGDEDAAIQNNDKNKISFDWGVNNEKTSSFMRELGNPLSPPHSNKKKSQFTKDSPEK